MVPYNHPTQRSVSQVDSYSPQMGTQPQCPNNIMWGIPRAIGQVQTPSYHQGHIPPPPPSLPPPPRSNIPQTPSETIEGTISGNSGDI